MANFKNAFITKAVVVLLSFSMILGMVPVSIVTSAIETENDVSNNCGSLSVISPGGSVTDANGKNPVATFDDITLTWSPADPSIGRTSDGWWIGVKLTAPSHLKTEEDLKDVTYQWNKSPSETWSSACDFWSTKDSADTDTEHYITLWAIVNEQSLNDALYRGTPVITNCRFDWDGNDADYEQTVSIKVNPEKVKLMKDGVQVYPVAEGMGNVTSLTDGLAAQSDANFVKFAFDSDVVLDWVEKDPEIGRMDDGWWAGLKISAPASFKTEEDFEGVTFQMMSGGTWTSEMAFWSFKDSKDTDTEHYVSLWGLINVDKLKNATKPFKYALRFDWNKDGVYEQIVILEIDHAKVTLNNAEGAQVFPELGSVTTITGGTVTGNQTGNIAVDVADVTLNWSPKDESVGRMQDGWWAGILITAPEGTVITDAEDNDVKYQSKVGDGEWSESKSFYNDQDSAKDGVTHYMQLWSVLNRELVENQDNVVSQWRFDWDKDGEFEQLVTFNIDSKTVTLTRIDRTEFSFEDTAENKEVWIGDGSYSNTIKGDYEPGEIVYSIDDSSTAEATIDEVTGEVTFITTGTLKINATIAETDVYNSADVSYIITVVKKQPEGLKFQIEEPSDIVYSENGTFENEANDPYSTGEVEYSIIEHKDLDGVALDAETTPVATIDENGKVTVLRSGKITVKAVLSEDGKYFGDEATYTLTINKAEQKDFNFAEGTPIELTYRTTPYETITYAGSLVGAENITFSIEEGTDVAEIVDGNKIQTLQSGSFKLVITNAGNDCYEAKTIEKVINVGLASQTTFAFTYSDPSNITYNENGNEYENEAIGGESTGDVTYKVVGDTDVADFEDPASHVLTIKKAGTVKVEATKAQDLKYAACTVEYEITIDLAKQSFTFENGENVTLYYGEKSYSNPVVPTEDATKADGIGYGNGKLTYSMAANDFGASIDPVTGEISFADSEAKIGKVTVNVTKEADEKYDACSASYTLEVVYVETPEDPYAFDREANENGWYNKDININAKPGYMIAFENELSTDSWATELTYSENGTTGPVVYLRDADGHITDAITVSNYKMDKDDPVNLEIGYDISVWDTVLENIFGYTKDKVTVTLKASDELSEIDYILYSTDNGNTYPEEQKLYLENGECSFAIDWDYRNNVEFKAVDKAGNISKYSDGKTVVVDTVDPALELEYSFTGSSNMGNIVYTNNDVTVTVVLKAANFDLYAEPVVVVDGAVQNVEWIARGEDEHIAVLDTFAENHDYVVTVNYGDKLGRTATCTQEIRVDKDLPEFDEFVFTPGDIKGENNGITYYDDSQTLKLTITEYNFDPKDVNFTLTADNNEVDARMYFAILKTSGAWTPGENNTWTAEIKLDKNANYEATLSYTDLAGNTRVSDTCKFTVDTEGPAKPVITLDKSALAKVLETITFGFFEAPVEVTVTSSDITAGVKEIKYSYVGKTGEYNEDIVNVGETLAVENNAITFTIPADTEFKGTLSATAYDWSLNDSETQTVVYDKNSVELGGIVVDNVDPDRQVIISKADRVVNEATLKDVESFDYKSEESGYILYYKDSATLTFIIDEANFYADDVHVYDNGVEMNPTDWTLVDNSWQGTITLTEEGDHIVTMAYTDKSENEMKPYESQKIVIDKTEPEISVKYNESVNTVGDRVYFDNAQTATITVTEHNFRADDIKITVTAKDINGSDVLTVDENGNVISYAEEGAERSKWSAYTSDWRRDDDTYEFTIKYDADANYTFDVEYTDLATNEDESDVKKELTVDATPAYGLTVENKDNFINNILSEIFFYDAKTTVEISAQDDVAGVEFFNISVIKDGLNEATTLDLPVDLVVNADGSVKSGTKGFIGDITSKNENGKVTLSFEVPEEFSGKIVADSATDLSHNEYGEYDDKYIVVDTVNPDVSVRFEGDLKDQIDVDVEGVKPTRQTKNTTDADTRFVYAGNITATITVKEANFYEDMVITVFRDGVEVTDCELSGWSQVGDTYEYVNTVTMSADGDYQIKLSYADKSGNNMDYNAEGEYAGKTAIAAIEYVSNIHTVDTTNPSYLVNYAPNATNATNEPTHVIDGREYYGAARSAIISITDRNFRPNEVVITVTAVDVNGEEIEFTYSDLKSWNDWSEGPDENTWIATVPFNTDANYTVELEYTDIAGHSFKDDETGEVEKYNKLFTVDTTPAYDLNVVYSQNFIEKILSTIFFYNAKTTVEISAQDDVAGIDFFNIKVEKDGFDAATTVELPENLVVYANGDKKSGELGFIEKITSKTENGKVTLSFEVPEEFRGSFVIESVTDLSHIVSEGYDDTNVVVVDTVNPQVTVEFGGNLMNKVDVDVEGEKPTRQNKTTNDENTRFVYNGDITATITVKEANFYEDMVITVYRDGVEVTDCVPTGWTQVGDTYEYVNTVTMSDDGDYQIQLDYADKSANVMDYEASEEYESKKGNGTYLSNIHTIDTTAPKYSVTYDNNVVKNTINDREYYDADRKATITITDRNFRPNEVEFTVIAKDINDEDVEYTYSNLNNKTWKDWNKGEEPHTWVAKVDFNVDANYTVELAYTDIAGNSFKDEETDKVEVYNKLFTVDKVAPSDLKIEFVEPTFIEKVIEAATFHFYNAPVTVRISATDDISGVHRFEYSYVKSLGVSDVNAELLNEEIENANNNIVFEGNKATATFVVPEEAKTAENQFRGTVEFTAYDRSENNDETSDDTVVVVDNIAPAVDIKYTANSDDTAVHFVDANLQNKDAFENATQAIYDGNVTATITINEANFFEGKFYTDENGEIEGIVHEVGILLTKTDNNGVVTKTEYLPDGTVQMFASETSNTKSLKWTSNGDVHTFKIDYDENADYVLTFKYVDFSANESAIEADDGKTAVSIYESKIVTVDKIDPVVKVEYSNTDVKNTIDGRDYFDKQQVATITVTEHNFRADDVIATVIAKNVVGADVAVEDFKALLQNRNNWKHYDENGNQVANAADGNVHVATITYSVDANYNFDIEYKDLALREIKDYAEDLFTVDKTAPTNLTVTYSEPKLWDNILETITFGFYNAQMEVTVTATDITSGIYHFMYSYLKSEGVSEVNAELIDAAISAAEITYNGATATAKFNIPKLVLNRDNQFNGTVEFTAYDRAENNTDMADEERIVVDNINPTSTITFNDPVQNVNNISYYAGNINATIVINEANFYSNDVNVTVTKDGVNYPVTVQWTDNSVDVHTGTFTLTEDGDYIVAVSYADRSTNEMERYESNRLTLDTKTPTVNVSNIKNNSANKDETYGFTITANDINIDMNSIKPVLTAVVRGEDGSYSKKEIALDNLKTIEAGKTYSFTVENLEEDAVYTLVCTLKDMSGNTYSNITLEDGNSYEAVVFSINRDGSTFTVDEVTDKLVEQYYVYSVNEDVIIEEINVDPIENYTVKLNGEELTEGEDYTTTLSDNEGEWSKRTYVIFKSLFDSEGEYNVIVESKDKADTTAFSDVKNLKVAFVVDQTAPVITISGLEENGRYQTEEQTVTIIPTDDGGKLKSILVITVDDDGKQLKELLNLADEALIEALEAGDGKLTFKVGLGLYQNIQIICNDCATDENGNTNEYNETIKNVSVNTNAFIVNFWANKPLRWGTIAGVILLIAAVIFLVVFRKNKKTNSK